MDRRFALNHTVLLSVYGVQVYHRLLAADIGVFNKSFIKWQARRGIETIISGLDRRLGAVT